jgi:hypothetical protein
MDLRTLTPRCRNKTDSHSQPSSAWLSVYMSPLILLSLGRGQQRLYKLPSKECSQPSILNRVSWELEYSGWWTCPLVI